MYKCRYGEVEYFVSEPSCCIRVMDGKFIGYPQFNKLCAQRVSIFLFPFFFPLLKFINVSTLLRTFCVTVLYLLVFLTKFAREISARPAKFPCTCPTCDRCIDASDQITPHYSFSSHCLRRWRGFFSFKQMVELVKVKLKKFRNAFGN